MTLLDNHLEQISLSARAIADLPYAERYLNLHSLLTRLRFPSSKIFTNALLGNPEITNLIRDTDPHERALFTVDPNATSATSSRRSTKRVTNFRGEENAGFPHQSIYTVQDPRRESAVARVLGGEMLKEIQRSSNNAKSQRNGGGSGVNVEALLRGAEKLCAV